MNTFWSCCFCCTGCVHTLSEYLPMHTHYNITLQYWVKSFFVSTITEILSWCNLRPHQQQKCAFACRLEEATCCLVNGIKVKYSKHEHHPTLTASHFKLKRIPVCLWMHLPRKNTLNLLNFVQSGKLQLQREGIHEDVNVQTLNSFSQQANLI